MRLPIVLFSLCLAPLALAGEFLAIPHIASDLNSFQTNLVLENRSASQQTVLLQAYAGHNLLDPQVIVLPPGARLVQSLAALYPEHHLTHMFMDRYDDLFAGVEYVPVAHPENRTYVEALRDFSQRWRIHPSNWQSTFDGVALVNPGCYSIEVSIIQRSADGSFVAALPLPDGGLGGFSKLVYSLSQAFQEIDGSYIEITATHPIAVMGLKGSTNLTSDFSFLVGNQAEPYPVFENLLRELETHRQQWLASGLSQNYGFELQGGCFCPQRRAARVTVSNGQLSRLIFADDGTDVSLAESRNYQTVAELFDLIAAVIDQGADDVRVEWNDQYGYPASITIDWLSCAQDEEQLYLVSSLAANDP